MEKAKISKKIDELLEEHGVRATAVRILICRTLAGIEDTFSINDIEMLLESVDRSTIFRTLTIFAEHHILHEIEDGSGQKKYCFCHNDHKCRPNEMHCHFFCEKCKKTYCLDGLRVPEVPIPEGFCLNSIEHLLRGLCRSCSSKN